MASAIDSNSAPVSLILICLSRSVTNDRHGSVKRPIRLCTRIDSRITPWVWAVNGAAGVLATGAVVLVSINTSLNDSLWVGAVAYALLAVVGPQLLKLEQATVEEIPKKARLTA